MSFDLLLVYSKQFSFHRFLYQTLMKHTVTLGHCQPSPYRLTLELLRDVTEPFNFLSSLGMGTDTKLKITLMPWLVT